MANWTPIYQIEKLKDVDDVEAVAAGPESSRPASPSVKLLYISNDTGRVDWWNGSSYDAVGLSEGEISLGNLGSHAHSDLSSSPEDAHHSKDHDHTEADISQVPNSGLSNSKVTVAGNNVALGGSTGIAHGDLGSVTENQHHNKDHDHSEADITQVPNAGLANSSLTVAGNVVSLGGTTGIDLADLSNAPHSSLDDAPQDAHHNRDHDHTSAGVSNVPNSGLVNDTVTLASTQVSLGSSSTFGLSDLSDLDAGSSRITNVSDPTSPGDVATKAYADNIEQGVFRKEAVRLASGGQWSSSDSYSGGTITNVSTGATGGGGGPTVDGVEVSPGDRLLAKNGIDEGSGDNPDIYNGLWKVDAVDTGNGVMDISRTADMNEDSEVQGGESVWVNEGSNNPDEGYTVTSDSPTLDMDTISWVKWTGAYSINPGTGINKSGDTLSVDEPNVNHDNLGGYVSNEHIDHSGISFTGGTGISGGGDLTSSRTFSLDFSGLQSLSSAPHSTDLIAIYDSSEGKHVEMQVSELEGGLNLADLGSHSHGDLSSAPADAHHPQIDIQDSGTSQVDGPSIVNLLEPFEVNNPNPGEVTYGIDGDVVPIDFTPSTYSPDSGAQEASDSDDVAAHLKGIDDELGSLASSGGGITWNVIDNDTTASIGEGYLIDSIGVTLTLPSSPTGGDFVAVGASVVGSTTIDGNGNDIDGNASFGLGDTRDPKGVYLVFDADSSSWEVVFAESGLVFDIGNDSTFEVQNLHLFSSQNEPPSELVSNPNPGEARFDWSTLPMDGYIEHGGLTISNNGASPSTDINVTGGRVGVHDFSDWTTAVLSDKAPAFRIDTTGAGGLINGTSRSANTWYALGIVADSDGLYDPEVVGYTVGNSPTSSSDLPSNYDLFRDMAQPGNSWWIRTDGSSNIMNFYHHSNGWVFMEAPDSVYSRLFASSGGLSSTDITFSVTSQKPPTTCDVHISRHTVIMNTSGDGTRIGTGPIDPGTNEPLDYQLERQMTRPDSTSGTMKTSNTPIVYGVDSNIHVVSHNSSGDLLVQYISGFKAVS